MPANKSAMRRYQVIDDCLRNTMRRYPGVAQLRDKVQYTLGTSISESMLHKDLAEMKALFGAPIAFDRARRGYYYTEADFSIRKFPLREDELRALDQSIAVLRQVKGTGLYARFENAIGKIIQGFRISEITGGDDRAYIQVEEPLVPEANEWMEPLLEGIVDGQLLAVDYMGFGREMKRHLFSPYLLKQYRNRWYAVGHSNRPDYTIVLALDRIRRVQPAKGTFVRDPGFEPEAYFRHAFGITHLRDARPETVHLRFTPQQAPYVRSQPLHHSQRILADTSEGLEVSLDVYVTPELTMAILAFGSGVRVLSPDTLAAQIRDTARAMAGLYGEG
jgi:predicted DNA-binding transcriptional regulator YafY